MRRITQMIAFFLLSAIPAIAESLSFSSSWSTYIGSSDNYIRDSVSSIALQSENYLCLGGFLGSGFIMDGNGDAITALNDDENLYGDGFTARVLLQGGANSLPQFARILNEDTGEMGNQINRLALDANRIVSVGYLDNGFYYKQGIALCYSSDLTETWRYSLPVESNSVFRTVSLASGGTVLVAGDLEAPGPNDTTVSRALALQLNGNGVPLWTRQYVDATRVTASLVNGSAWYLACIVTNGMGIASTSLKKIAQADGTEEYALSLPCSITSLALDSRGALIAGGSSGLGVLYKLRDTGSALEQVWTKTLPGSSSVNGIALDGTNRIAVAGNASTSWFNATDGTSFGGTSDGFALILSPDASETLFASWLGGNAETTADCVTFSGDVLAVGGQTRATDWIRGGFCTRHLKLDYLWEDEELNDIGYIKVWLGQTFIPNPPGTLTVSIMPPDAVVAGAAWSVDNGRTWMASGASTNLMEGSYTITFHDADEYYTPESQSVTIESEQTNTIWTIYASVPPPIAKRTINGTNVTVRLVLPSGLKGVELSEYIPEGLDCETDDEDAWWRPRLGILYFDKSPPRGYVTAANEEIIITYTVSGEPGTYTLSGDFEGTFSDNTATNAPVEGDYIVTIRNPSEIIAPPPPDITAFIPDANGWLLTFVSTQQVNYAVLTNSDLTLPFPRVPITTVAGENGTTTVHVQPQAPKLFFRVEAQPE